MYQTSVTGKVVGCLLLGAIFVIMVVVALRQHRKQLRRGRASAQRRVQQQARLWAQIVGGIREHHGRLAQVEQVYQLARRGTKAIIRWHDTGECQDAWFASIRVVQGQWLLLRGGDGYGWHHGTYCRFVTPQDVFVTAAADAPDCFRRFQESTDPAEWVV